VVDMTDSNYNRFVANFNDFQFLDEDGNVVPQDQVSEYLRKRKEEYDKIPKRGKIDFLNRGDVVKISCVSNPVVIFELFSIINERLFDYTGYELIENKIIQDKLHHFDHEQIVEHVKKLSLVQEIERKP